VYVTERPASCCHPLSRILSTQAERRAQKPVRATHSNRFWLHFFFRRSRRCLLSSLASQSRACACSAMGMRDGNMIYSPFLHYFLNPAPTTYVESGLHTPWKSCYLTPGLQLQAPSNHSRRRHCPAAGIPREARARHAASSPPTARAVAARARAASPRSCAPCGSSTASRRESWLSPEINRRNLNPDFKTRVHGTHGDTRARRGAHGEAAVGLHIQEHGDHRIPAPQSCDPAACSSAPAWAWLAEPQRTVYIVPWTDEES
jgi:hypothetical protein